MVVLEETLEVPWTTRSIHSILKEINLEYSLEGLMLKLKQLQYFGHLMRTSDSLEKTLMLGKIEGRRRRGWQRMRWLDGITDSMDMSLIKLWVLVSMGSKELDMTERLNNNKYLISSYSYFCILDVSSLKLRSDCYLIYTLLIFRLTHFNSPTFLVGSRAGKQVRRFPSDIDLRGLVEGVWVSGSDSTQICSLWLSGVWTNVSSGKASLLVRSLKIHRERSVKILAKSK